MIVAGFGFRASATLHSFQDAYGQAGPATALATAEDKAQHPEFQAFAKQIGVPIIPVKADILHKQSTPTHSKNSQKHRKTGSLCEAAACAAAGPEAQLLGPRVISSDRRATCALAATTGLTS